MKVSPFDSPGKRGKNTAFPPKARNQTLTRGMRRLFPFAYKDVTPPIAPRCPFLVRPYRHPPSYSLNAPTRYVFLISVLEWSRSLTHLFLPSLTVASPCRSKTRSRRSRFPPGKRGGEVSREIRYSQFRPTDCHRNREGKGSLRLFSPYAFHLLDSSRYSPFPASFQLFLPSIFLFSFFLSFFFFLFPFLSSSFLSLYPFYFRRSIERELGSVFSLRTFSRSQLLPSSSFEDDCFLGSNPWYLDTF